MERQRRSKECLPLDAVIAELPCMCSSCILSRTSAHCFPGADGSEEAWHFPQRSHEPGETIRQTAECALADVLTDDEGRQVYFIGHSPAGHGRYPGWDLFFHRAQLIKGTATLRPGGSVHDFAWVTKEELPEYIKDPNAQNLFNMILAGP